MRKFKTSFLHLPTCEFDPCFSHQFKVIPSQIDILHNGIFLVPKLFYRGISGFYSLVHRDLIYFVTALAYQEFHFSEKDSHQTIWQPPLLCGIIFLVNHLITSHLESWCWMSCFDDFSGVNVLGTKSELEKVMEKRNRQRVEIEKKSEIQATKTDFQKVLEERAKKIEDVSPKQCHSFKCQTFIQFGAICPQHLYSVLFCTLTTIWYGNDDC